MAGKATAKPKKQTQPKGGKDAKPKLPKKGSETKPKASYQKGADSKPKPSYQSKSDAPAAAYAGAASLQPLATKLTESGTPWYSLALKPLKAQKQEPVPVAKKGKKQSQPKPQEPAVNEEAVQRLKSQAQKLVEDEVQRYEAKKSGKLSSDDKYLATMMKSGTLADRVAALTLTVQASPFHGLSRLSQLITMASKKARRESLMAVDSLKDLFLNNLLPDDRKLNFFHQNPVTHPSATPEHLALWFFEHCLKTAFAQLVGVLSDGMDNAIDNHKRACIRAANALLTAKPEQEAVLLAMLVNKLGDPDRKIAAYIHKTLQDLLRDHPVMKRVVVDEVERLLTRPKVSDRTKYNAILFLNQIYLDKSGDDGELAAHLISVYFGLFSKEVHADDGKPIKKDKKKSKKGKGGSAKDASAMGMDRKLLSSLLVGVNRAFPYANATSADFQSEIDTLFVVVHKAHHSTGVQALMLLFQVMNSTNSVSDRFYNALYAKLLDTSVRETSKHTLFLNLIFRAIKADTSPARTGAMMKRLLQLTTVMTPAFTCAVLFLLSEVLKLKPQLRTLFDQPEAGSAGQQSEEQFHDAAEVEKEDKDENEEEDSEDVEGEETNDDGLTDADRAQRVLEQMFGGSKEETSAATASTGGVQSFDDDNASKPAATATGYDPTKRNPLYAGAETSCAWEMHHLVQHYHPSVQMFARQLLLEPKTGVQYAGDPLVDFTMHAFFEKFMNKKPRHKGVEATTGGTTQEKKKSWTFVPINTDAVLQEAEENIDATDQFFYKFFKERASRESTRPKKKKKSAMRDGDGEDRDGDAFSDVDEGEDEEMEAFAQQLAEGIMQDGDHDDEDPDMGDWSGAEDDEEEDGGELEGEDDDGEFAAEGAAGEDSEDEGNDFDFANEGDDDDEDDDEGQEDDDEDDEDDDDDADGFDFGAMDGSDAEEYVEKQSKKKAVPAAKRKSMFADADDYEQMVKDALAKQSKQRGGNKKQRRK